MMLRKLPNPEDTLERAKDLRAAMTEAEKRLWYYLQDRRFENLKFRRQHPVPPYIVDFYCDALKLIVELDGGQHSQETDALRTATLESKGYKIICFWNNDVLSNTDGVLTELKEKTWKTKNVS